MGEMRQSVRILEQVMETMPDGDSTPTTRKIVLPPKERVLSDMEALIHHFILVTRGFPVPPARLTPPSRVPKGELGFYVVADGSEKPYRVRVRPPSFYNLGSLPHIVTRRHGRPTSSPSSAARTSSWARSTRPRHDGRTYAFTEQAKEKRYAAKQMRRAKARVRVRSALGHALYIAQEECGGWIPYEAIKDVAEVMGLEPADVQSMMSFYVDVQQGPVGKYMIEVCHNIACSLLGVAAAGRHDGAASAASIPARPRGRPLHPEDDGVHGGVRRRARLPGQRALLRETSPPSSSSS